MLVRRYGDTDFITGLRAVAAFMVVSIHTSAFRDFGALGENLTDNGKYGVHVFFVISGFTVAANFEQLQSYKAFLVRRLLRIAPLYYLTTATMFAAILFSVVQVPYWMERYDSSPNFYNFFMHLSFLSAWDVRVANSLIGTEWTIPIEIFWYLLLPLLLPFSKSRLFAIRAFAALAILAAVTAAVAEIFLPSPAAHFMPTTYGAFFFLGAVCFNLRERASRWSNHRCKKWTRLGMAGLAVTLILPSNLISPVLVAIATSAIIVGYKSKDGLFQILTTRPMLFLGSISYSIYLWHYIVITFLRLWLPETTFSNGLLWFLFVACATTVVSAISYKFVEQPSNRLGRFLARQVGNYPVSTVKN